MIDAHVVPEGWGILPKIFGISTYAIFVLLGLLVGCAYFLLNMKKDKYDGERATIIILSVLIGSTIGAKLPIILVNFSSFIHDPKIFLSGRSVLGGLLGGMSGILITKKICNIKGRYGNDIAPAAALGIAIGRIGCFLSGCCYGKICKYGIDFGDGYNRYPTQIFEFIFHLSAFFILAHYKNIVHTKGILFNLYVISYFIFRYFTEFIRESEVIFGGQTLYQIICILGIIVISIKIVYNKKHN